MELKTKIRNLNKRNRINRLCVECGNNKPEPIFTEYCSECRSKISG